VETPSMLDMRSGESSTSSLLKSGLETRPRPSPLKLRNP
jgi:hypothetical protein